MMYSTNRLELMNKYLSLFFLNIFYIYLCIYIYIFLFMYFYIYFFYKLCIVQYKYCSIFLFIVSKFIVITFV